MQHTVGLQFDASLLPDALTDDIEFRDTSYFRGAAGSIPAPPLPPPATVLAEHPHAHSGVVRYDTSGVIVKFGLAHKVRIEEAQALQAVRRAFPHNEVPVPELFGWKSSAGYNFIYMSIVPGQTLNSVWTSLSTLKRESIAEQLSRIVSKLRELKQPPAKECIGSINRGPVCDLYFRSNPEYSGPFKKVKEFNDMVFFLTAPWVPIDNRMPDPYRKMIPDHGRVYFTHADLNVENILILRSSSGAIISGIIDWEQCGWYPEYWEYCKMQIGNSWYHEWNTLGFASRSMRAYEEEYVAMAEYWQWRCP